ncbi:hypothetical protein Tco_0402067 [Tanacetum coccineum]
MERKIGEWSTPQNHVPSEQTNRINPPPPQAQVEHVNVVFTRCGKFDDHPIIQKDTPPPIIVNSSIEKDQPIKEKIQALEQETRDLDAEHKQMKMLKAIYSVTTPQELRHN